MAQLCCENIEIKKLSRKMSPKLKNEQFSLMAKALGHPARIQILEILRTKESCICGEIVEILPLSQATVSQHLKTLKEAGFIKGEIDGPSVCYCIDRNRIKEFKILVSEL